MDGSHDELVIYEARRRFWQERYVHLDGESAKMMALSRAAVARSQAILDRTRRQLDASDRMRWPPGPKEKAAETAA